MRSVLEETGMAAQRELLLETLQRNDWSLTRTSKALRTHVGTMAYWLRRLDLVEAYRAGRASVGKACRLEEKPRTREATTEDPRQRPLPL